MAKPSLSVYYHTAPSPIGTVFIGATEKGICTLMILSKNHKPEQSYHALMDSKINTTELQHSPERIKPYMDAVLNHLDTGQDISHLPLDIYGTDFQKSVWQTLLKIPCGQTVTYSHIAHTIKSPTAIRATGTAIGRNPISIIIPCHRVVNKSGGKINYLWGVDVKVALQNIEKKYK